MPDNILSMTGYGEASASFSSRDWRITVQSVNSRYLDLRFCLPSALLACEGAFRERLKTSVERGKVDVVLNYSLTDGSASELTRSYFNKSWIAGFCEAGTMLIDSLQWPASDQLRAVILQSAFNRREAAAVDDEADTLSEFLPQLLTLFDNALEAHRNSCQQEGLQLALDIKARLQSLSQGIDAIELSARDLPAVFKERLELRVAALLSDRTFLDESRLAQEISYLVDKADITEELVRFRAHLSQFLHELEIDTSVRKGKKLEFITQEMLREINTIGSKSGILQITQCVVDAKNELERIREQIQNVI